MIPLTEDIDFLTNGTFKPCSGICMLPVRTRYTVNAKNRFIGSVLQDGVLRARVGLSQQRVYGYGTFEHHVNGCIIEHPVSFPSCYRYSVTGKTRAVVCAQASRIDNYNVLLKLRTENGTMDALLGHKAREKIMTDIYSSLEVLADAARSDYRCAADFYKTVTGSDDERVINFISWYNCSRYLLQYARDRLDENQDLTLQDMRHIVGDLGWVSTNTATKPAASFRVKIAPIQLDMLDEWEPRRAGSQAPFEGTPISRDKAVARLLKDTSTLCSSTDLYRIKKQMMVALCRYEVTAIPEERIRRRLDKLSL